MPDLTLTNIKFNSQMEIEDASPERESRERKGKKSLRPAPVRRGKKREITSSSEDEVAEPEYVEDDTENENQEAAKASGLGRSAKPSTRKTKSSNDEKYTATQNEEEGKEVAETSKSRGRKGFTTKSSERSSRPGGRRSRIDVEDSVSKDAESANVLDASENQNDITTTGENQKTYSTADTARTNTTVTVAMQRPRRSVASSGGTSLSKDSSVYDFGETETGPPASPTRKSGRTRTSTAKFAEHVVDRYDATSRQQLRRGAKDRCKESLQEQSESDVDAVMHEATIALPLSESKAVQSRPSGRRNRQQLQEEPANPSEPTATDYSAVASGEDVLLVPSATEVRAENELAGAVDGENKDKVDEEVAAQGLGLAPKANSPARPRGVGGLRGRGRWRGRGRGRGRPKRIDAKPAQLDEKMEIEQLAGDESKADTVEESTQPSNGGITTQERLPTDYSADYQFAEEGTECSIPVVQESLKQRGVSRSQRATRLVQPGSETGPLGEPPAIAADDVTTVNDATVQPMSGRRSKRQTAALSALKSRALLEEHSDSDASMSTRRSSRSRSSVGRTETPPRATTGRSTGRRGRTRATEEHEDQPSTTTEDYNNDSDSDTQGKRKRKTKTKLSLRQRNARRKQGGSTTGSLEPEPEVNESEVPEGVEENFQHHREEEEGMAEGNNNKRNDEIGGEEQNDKDNVEKKDDDASLPLAATNVPVKNLPLKMRIRISRMTEEDIERLSNRSDMEDSVAEKPVKKTSRKGRKARSLREKSEPKLTSEENGVGFQGAIQDGDADIVENNSAVGDGNERNVGEGAKNKEADESRSVANNKPEFSSDSEKEGKVGEEEDGDKDNSLVWKTADEEKGPAEEGTELLAGESAPPAEDGARTTAVGGRRAAGGSHRGRGARGRKGRPPSKRARVEESAEITISDSD